MDEDLKQEIDSLTHREMCLMWRFGKGRKEYFDTQHPASEYFKERLFKNFDGFTPEISKDLGW